MGGSRQVTSRARVALALVAAAVCASMSCGSSDGTAPPPPPSGPSLRIVAGANLTDTVQVRPAQALTVEVRDSAGKPRSGVVVRFEALIERSRAVIFVGALTSQGYVFFVTDSTDALGHAHALVAFGNSAGPARVAIHVPALGLVDTARFTVTAGASARVVFGTRDTALAVGKRFLPNASAADRFGNPRADPLTYTALSPVCSVDAAGQITALTIGRCAVLARSAASVDTARASVVPDGTLAVLWIPPESGLARVSTVQLDGSNLRHLTSVLGGEVFPTSTRGGSSVVYREGDRLMVVDAAGAKRRLVTTGGGLSWEGWARFSRDSAWVYFAGDGALHRVRRDGTGYERIAMPDSSAVSGTQPDPAPDGARLAYALDGTIRILTLGATTPALRTVDGILPRWSPAGDRIAFLNGQQVWVMDASGQNAKIISPVGRSYGTGHDWSADGQWIVGRGVAMLELINVSTGEVLPLPYSATTYEPTFLR